MERWEIEGLREKVSCGLVLEQAGFRVDVKESTRRAIKYRRGGDIAIVTHAGRGWFDPHSDKKGDVFGLAAWLQPGDFAATLKSISALGGVMPSGQAWTAPDRPKASAGIPERWAARLPLRPGSPAFGYLTKTRMIPPAVLHRAGLAGVLRHGPFGSAWFAHENDSGQICGWEERGAKWRGFSSGGTKVLFRFGNPSPARLCVTEAAIDALSFAAIEGTRRDTLYASTAGGWSPATQKALSALAGRVDLLIAAGDRNSQGEVYADYLRQIATQADCGFQRLRPQFEDWNDDLSERGGG